MLVERQTLEDLLLNNVVDLRFTRRHPVAGKSATRRMLCTKSYNLLQSTNGRIVLNYAPPKHNKQFNESKNNALVVWDILMQNYRIVSVDRVDVLEQVPADEAFWQYFNDKIYPMSTLQKLTYMDT